MDKGMEKIMREAAGLLLVNADNEICMMASKERESREGDGRSMQRQYWQYCGGGRGGGGDEVQDDDEGNAGVEEHVFSNLFIAA
jgi:hypothetical protein